MKKWSEVESWAHLIDQKTMAHVCSLPYKFLSLHNIWSAKVVSGAYLFSDLVTSCLPFASLVRALGAATDAECSNLSGFARYDSSDQIFKFPDFYI